MSVEQPCGNKVEHLFQDAKCVNVCFIKVGSSFPLSSMKDKPLSETLKKYLGISLPCPTPDGSRFTGDLIKASSAIQRKFSDLNAE